MAEETQGVQNTGLLIVAIVLAVVVAVVYNAHIAQVKKVQKGKMRELLQYANKMERGETIDEDDLVVVRVPVHDARGFTNVVSYDSQSTVTGKKLSVRVRAGQWVMWGHTSAGASDSADSMIRDGPNQVGIPIEIEAETSPGILLTAGGRVNLVGRFPDGKGKLSAFLIIENVPVLSVGGGASDIGAPIPGVTAKPQKSYRQIMIDLTSEQHLRLLDVLNYIDGPISIQVLNRDVAPPDPGGDIDDKLLKHLSSLSNGGSSSSRGRSRGGR